jgi:hypothetical protein
MIRSKGVEATIRTEIATATRSPSQSRTKEEAMHPKDPYTSLGKSICKTIMNIRGLIPWVGSRRSVPPKSDFVPPEFIFIDTSDAWTVSILKQHSSF